MIDKDNLPAPRLQLRWAPSTIKPGYNWECHYELVLPLDKYDIRATRYGDDGEEEIGAFKELVVPIKTPSLRESTNTPCGNEGSMRYYDSPFRDGAHAYWDAKHLGNPPIFVIAPDGMAFPRPDRESGGKENPK
jgi:hypothetical protein